MSGTAKLFRRFIGADSRIAAVNLMEAWQLRVVLETAGLQRSVRSCAAVRLRQIEQAPLSTPQPAGTRAVFKPGSAPTPPSCVQATESPEVLTPAGPRDRGRSPNIRTAKVSPLPSP